MEFQIFALTLPISLIYKDMGENFQNQLWFVYSHDVLHHYISMETLSPTELLWCFSSGGMTKVLNKLDRENLIKREPSLNDKRSTLICLTLEGWNFSKRLYWKSCKNQKQSIFWSFKWRRKINLQNDSKKNLVYSKDLILAKYIALIRINPINIEYIS